MTTTTTTNFQSIAGLSAGKKAPGFQHDRDCQGRIDWARASDRTVGSSERGWDPRRRPLLTGLSGGAAAG